MHTQKIVSIAQNSMPFPRFAPASQIMRCDMMSLDSKGRRLEPMRIVTPRSPAHFELVKICRAMQDLDRELFSIVEEDVGRHLCSIEWCPRSKKVG